MYFSRVRPSPALTILNSERYVGTYEGVDVSCVIDRGKAADPLAMFGDMAFFGRDKKGRAMNMLHIFFRLVGKIKVS